MSKLKSLWLDDERPEPEGWVRARTAPEAIAFLETRDFGEVSLDHDLGACAPCTELAGWKLPQCQHTSNGYAVVCWLEERVMTDVTFPIPVVYVHTQNAAALPRMMQAVRKIQWVWQQRMSEDQ